MIAIKHCWWCGNAAQVDTELPESGGMVRDTETSWLCTDSGPCGERAYVAMSAGIRRGAVAP